MEYVAGLPLTTFAERRGLHLRARLRLMREVCLAVDHAHRRGAIHRDLKPDNVLVDEEGRPKVLDFGIARLLSDASEETAVTQAGQVLGTLAYMSPEQLGGDPRELEVCSDVYSLGVMTYELIAGRLPVDLRGCSVVEAVRRLDRTTPTPLGAVDRAWRGDVQTIVARAMAIEKRRRYADARALVEDIERYLDRRPIRARPASVSYRARRWTQRHPVRFTLLAVAAAVFLVGAPLLADWLEARHTVRAWGEHVHRRELEERLGGAFLILGDASVNGRLSQQAVEAFEEIAREEAGSPEASAGLALALMRDGRAEQALDVIAASEAAGGPACALGWLRREALLILMRGEEARELEARLARPSDPLDYYVWGVIALDRALRRRDDPEAFRQAALALRRAVLCCPEPRAIYHYEYAQAAWRAGDVEAARALPVALLRHWPDSALAAQWAACCRDVAGDVRGAVELFERAIELNPDLVLAHGNLGLSLAKLGRLEEAAECHARVIGLQPRRYEGHYNLGKTLYNLGRYPEAARALEGALEVRGDSADAHQLMASTLLLTDELERALRHAERAVELSPSSPGVHWILGSASSRLEDWAGCERALREELRLVPGRIHAWGLLAMALQMQGQEDAAWRTCEEALDRFPESAELHGQVGALCITRYDWTGALEAFQRHRELLGEGRRVEPRVVEMEGTARRMARIEARADDVRAGRLPPESAVHAAEMGEFCLEEGRYLRALEYYRLALELDPEVAMSPYAFARYNAACCAALASAGRGVEGAGLDPAERRRLGRQALAWLREEAAGMERALEEGSRSAADLSWELKRWFADADLDPLRPEHPDCVLEEEDRAALEELWHSVRALAERLR